MYVYELDYRINDLAKCMSCFDLDICHFVEVVCKLYTVSAK